eukprot:TRINITY_DN113064_c0_g1_i1.p1 TRINITY_DN113064_c0_g1~~TRINITY_DN113064_c0_g1_i1.p1  ORF type:complete len:273 (+),score=12.14 TRINITY_DN113064_c0_g1_i1:75-821(+)
MESEHSAPLNGHISVQAAADKSLEATASPSAATKQQSDSDSDPASECSVTLSNRRSSNSESCQESSHECSHSTYKTESSESSDSNDSPVVVLGMMDTTTGWRFRSDRWVQRPRDAAAKELRMSDFLELPTGGNGERMSVGSLGCLTFTRTGCTPCVFNAKVREGGKACHSGPSCRYCHVLTCFQQTRTIARNRRRLRVLSSLAARVLSTHVQAAASVAVSSSASVSSSSSIHVPGADTVSSAIAGEHS